MPETAPAYDIGEDLDDHDLIGETVSRLAALSPIQFDQVKKEEAERLGCGVTALTKEVRAARKASPGGALFPEIQPWPDPVDGDDLLHQIATAARKYIVLPPHGAELIALWAFHAHCTSAFFHSPRLAVMAPERRCGKSVVLDFLEALVPRPVKTENLSVAVLFRVCEEFSPTVLADEVDGYLKTNPELASMFNAGHKRGGKALRCEGDDNQVKVFNVFGPCALAGIGTLSPALGDRCISLTMRRATKDERPQPFRSDRAEHEHELARMCARWAADNIDTLKTLDPPMPGWMFNRVCDNWRPLFAVSEICGGGWPELAINAAARLEAVTDAASYREMLLADIAVMFDDIGLSVISSDELVSKLADIETRPWGEYGRVRKPISKVQLANLLRPLGVSPGTVRIGTSTAKGYRLDQFTDVFARYTPTETSHRHNPQNSGPNRGFRNVTSDSHVTDQNRRKDAEALACDGVTDRGGGCGENTPDSPHGDGVWEH